MSSINTISIDKLARLIGTPECPVIVDVRTDEDFAADPRLIPGSVRRAACRPLRSGRRSSPAAPPSSSARRARSSARASPPGCAMQGVPAEALEGGFAALGGGRPAAWCRADKLPPRDAPGPHGLGDARAPEDRPHRLPLADPPLRRSECGVPVRRARPRSRRWPSASAPRRSTSRARSSGATAARSCTFDVMVEEFGLATAPLLAPCHDRARRRHGPARPRAGGARPARRLARPVAHVCRRPRAARGRAWRSTTPSTAGAATPPRRPTTGRRTKPRTQLMRGATRMSARRPPRRTRQHASSRPAARRLARRGLPGLAAGRRAVASAARPGRSR